MALVSNINVDSASGTIAFTSSVLENDVENITYDSSTNEITFDARADIIIDFSEFIALCNQINIFQTAILFIYPGIDVFATHPFSQLIINELHDPGMWSLTVSPHTDPNVMECQGTKSSTKMEMLPRSGSKTLSFPEWQYFLQALNHYRLSIKSF